MLNNIGISDLLLAGKGYVSKGCGLHFSSGPHPAHTPQKVTAAAVTFTCSSAERMHSSPAPPAPPGWRLGSFLLATHPCQKHCNSICQCRKGAENTIHMEIVSNLIFLCFCFPTRPPAGARAAGQNGARAPPRTKHFC